jgi:hypothetical protein
MSLGTAIRRANQRYDEWSKRAVERFIANVDHPQEKGATRKHISLWDLVANGLDTRKKSP